MTSLVAVKFRKRCHRETTLFLSGIKKVLRRHLGLWKPKHNAIEDPVLMMNAKFFVCLFFNLLCFFFQVTGELTSL